VCVRERDRELESRATLEERKSDRATEQESDEATERQSDRAKERGGECVCVCLCERERERERKRERHAHIHTEGNRYVCMYFVVVRFVVYLKKFIHVCVRERERKRAGLR